jgi:hypothetical protein
MDGYSGLMPSKIFNHGLVEDNKTRMLLRRGIEYKLAQGAPAAGRVDWTLAATSTESTEEVDIVAIEKKREVVAQHTVATSTHLRDSTTHLSMRKTKRKAGACVGNTPIGIEEKLLTRKGGLGVAVLQQELKNHALPHYGSIKELVARLKTHFSAVKHTSSKRAKPKDIASFFAVFQQTPSPSLSSSSSSVAPN